RPHAGLRLVQRPPGFRPRAREPRRRTAGRTRPREPARLGVGAAGLGARLRRALARDPRVLPWALAGGRARRGGAPARVARDPERAREALGTLHDRRAWWRL